MARPYGCRAAPRAGSSRDRRSGCRAPARCRCRPSGSSGPDAGRRCHAPAALRVLSPLPPARGSLPNSWNSRMKVRLLLTALLLVLPACKGDSTGGEPEIVALLLMPDDRTLAVGETLQLTAVVRDDTGEEPEADVLAETAWSSDAPGVAAVNAQGVVTGVAPGTANIRAELEDQSSTVLVTVAAAPPPCTNPAAVRSLAIGQSVVLGGIAAATIC